MTLGFHDGHPDFTRCLMSIKMIFPGLLKACQIGFCDKTLIQSSQDYHKLKRLSLEGMN